MNRECMTSDRLTGLPMEAFLILIEPQNFLKKNLNHLVVISDLCHPTHGQNQEGIVSTVFYSVSCHRGTIGG